MAINVQYATEMHEKFGYLATWLPTANVEVGDVGKIENGIFEKAGTLTDYQIVYQVKEEPQKGDIEYSSSDAVSVEVKAAGAAPVAGVVGAKVDAVVKIGFKRADAILFQASQCKSKTISNIFELGRTILNLNDQGDWPDGLVVVTDVVSCEAATVLISSGAEAHIELAVNGKLAEGQASLAKADASITVSDFSAMATHIVGKRGTTPLFKARGVKKSWLPWRDAEFKTMKGPDNLEFSELGVNDLLVAAPPPRAG